MSVTTEASRGRGGSVATGRRYLIVGNTVVARRVCATLRESGAVAGVTHLTAPSDEHLRLAFGRGVDSVAILIRDDVAALRYALAVAHLEPDAPMIVTIFDKTISAQLRGYLPQASVISPASLAAPSLAGPVARPGTIAAFCRDGVPHTVREVGGVPALAIDDLAGSPLRRELSRVAAAMPSLRSQHVGSKLLMSGLAGLVAVLVADWMWLVALEHRAVEAAFVESARVVATVGPTTDAHGRAYSAFAGIAMLLTIGFTAIFTAGVVDRLVAPPLIATFGKRSLPKRNHVIVVGMGQVGLRLACLLRELGVPVVGVEHDKDASLLGTARRLDIPVVVAEGTDRRTLERLGLRRSRGLAAVASDELANIAVAVTAAAVAPSVRVTLRAGEQEALVETRSLLRLGATRDVTAIASAFVVAHLDQRCPEAVTATSTGTWVRSGDDAYRRQHVSRRDSCRHQTPGPNLLEADTSPRGPERRGPLHRRARLH